MKENLITENIIDDPPNYNEKMINQLGSNSKDIYLHSNCISKLFFHWAYRIIKLSNITQLKIDYLGIVEGKKLSKNYCKNFEDLWENKNYKKINKMPLLKTALRANFMDFNIMFFLSIIVALIDFLSVYLFRLYIKLYQKDYIPSNPYYTKLNIGILFISFKIIKSFVMRQANMFQNILGYKVSNQIMSIIYKKVLKVSPSSMKTKSSEGEIINFLQVDTENVAWTMNSSPLLFIIPVQIIVYSYMLFEFMGFSFIFGFGAMIFFLVTNVIIRRRYKKIQKELSKKRDVRMQLNTETFNSLKLLKLYGWEDEFLNRIRQVRDQELALLSKIFKFMSVTQSLLWFAPVAMAVATIGAYQYLSESMNIEDIFTGLNIFSSIQEPIRNIPSLVSDFLELTVSLQRIENFLNQEEIDTTQILNDDMSSINKGISIKIERGNFSWGVNLDGDENGNGGNKNENKKNSKNIKEKHKNITKKPKNSNYEPLGENVHLKINVNRDTHLDKSDSDNSEPEDKSYLCKISINNSSIKSSITSFVNPIPLLAPPLVLKNINLEIYRGELICIIGEVGSGKTSLLEAILNNMIQIKNSSDNPSDHNAQIIINGSLSYCSQIPWIQNDTLKNNILFHSPYDEKKYNYVIDCCELRPDLSTLIGGDMTEIGEKGINLSGGQKARLSLARAVYADKDILLLDDPISALDAHVGQNVMKNLIVKGLSHKTRLLVTHSLQYLSYADRIVKMENGEIKWIGTYPEIKNLIQSSTSLERENSPHETTIIKDSDEKEVKRITLDEDQEKGQVKKEVYLTYMKYMGGLTLFGIMFIIMCSWQLLKGGSDLWLSYWTKNQSKENNLNYYLIYAALTSTSAIFVFFRVFSVSSFSLECTRKVHEQMIEKLVHAPINTFHDRVPKGQILNRLSKDISLLDRRAVIIFSSLLSSLFSFLGSIIVCSIIEPYSIIFLPFLFLIGYWLTQLRINANRDLSRINGVCKSPFLNLLAETIPGSSIIRGFKLTENFHEKFYSRIDDLNKVRYFMLGSSEWFGMILDFLTVTFFIFLIIFSLLFEDSFSAADIGILMTYSLSLQSSLFRLLTTITKFEVSMVTMERCLKYTQIPSELPRTTELDENLASWPGRAQIEFINYSVKYRPETDLVLKNLNFTIQAGEKLGVVGRTGSGKSTLCLSLFRILEAFSGTILVDGVDISKLGLNKLRSALTIIPQDPILMKGSLKYNIDPIGLYSEEEIKEVMKIIDFWYICERDDKGLQQSISENGSNLSVGEKQLICITRAILRKSKIIVMDEATANIDIKSEEIIQKAITQVLSQSTVITIAHRIKTIFHYDKILVLNNGEIIEHDSPQNLIENKQSLFHQLYIKSCF